MYDIFERGGGIIDTFGKRLKELRKKLGLSQEAMAKELDVARSTYALYETDKREPSLKVAARMRQIAGDPPSSLFDEPWFKELNLTEGQKVEFASIIDSAEKSAGESTIKKIEVIRSLLLAEGYEVIVPEDTATAIFIIRNRTNGISLELSQTDLTDLYDSLVQYFNLKIKEKGWDQIREKEV